MCILTCKRLTLLVLLLLILPIGRAFTQDTEPDPVLECCPIEKEPETLSIKPSYESRITFGGAKSETSWDNSYAFQLGPNGFFGRYNVDNGFSAVPPLHSIGDYASANGWFGDNLVSGASSASSRLFTLAEPIINITSAVKIKAAYQVGPYNIATALDRPISTGNWRWWAVEADTPWGLIYYGKRRFGWGRGLQFSFSRTEEFLGISVPIFVEEALKEPIPPCKEPPAEPFSWRALSRGYRGRFLIIGAGVYPFRRAGTAYWDASDLNGGMAANAAAYLNYAGRDTKFQIGTVYSKYAEGPESQAAATARASFPRTDFDVSEGWLFLEWAGGRFSLASELTWYYGTTRYQRSLDGTFNGIPDNTDGSGSRFAPRYIESWRSATLFTAASGPSKIQITYVRMPGPDRRHGIRIDRQPFVQLSQQGASDVFGAFNSIMGSTYSGGVDGFADVPDANFYGFRLDYSLAANLNLFCRAATARRISHGYGWGYIRPDLADIRRIDYGLRGDFLNPSPAIPDNDLGYETGAGIVWELLESWTFNFDVNYWKPGRWFNYACVDKSVPNWNIPTPSNNFGIRPDRAIDPVVVVNLSLGAEF